MDLVRFFRGMLDMMIGHGAPPEEAERVLRLLAEELGLDNEELSAVLEKRPVDPEKPLCKLLGENGNVFNLIGLTTNTLEDAGMTDKAEEFGKLAHEQEDYNAVLRLIMRYVEVY